MKKFILLIPFYCFFTQKAFAWGLTGHRVVGEIAQRHMSKSALKKLGKIMGKESLAVAANWPDEMRSSGKWDHAAVWHYVSISDGGNYYLNKESEQEIDIVKAIENQMAILKNKNSTSQEKKVAVRWLTHLIGDIHQPLHVGRAADKGGNDIKINWFGKETNLHKIWDSDIIDSQKLSYTDYVLFIDTLNKKEIQKIQQDDINIWIKEAVDYRSAIYNFKADSDGYWSYGYTFTHKNFLNDRLRRAGYRLASYLEKALE